MSVEKTHADGTIERRRTRELYITTLEGREPQVTLYRDHQFKSPMMDHFMGGRDDRALVLTAGQIAPMTVTDANGETRSGAYLMDLISRFCDAADEDHGVSLLREPPKAEEPEPAEPPEVAAEARR